MFVYKIGQQEDDLSKRVKIDALKLMRSGRKSVCFATFSA